MINVKKWLAALLTAAMVISGSGFAALTGSLAVYAAEGAWKITRAQEVKLYDTLQQAYDDAQPGEEIYPTESLEASGDNLTAGSVTTQSAGSWSWTTGVVEPKNVTIHTEGINYTGTIRLAPAFNNLAIVTVFGGGSYGPYCIGIKDGVYKIGRHNVKDVKFAWDFANARARVTEVCDGCGEKHPQNEYVNATVTTEGTCTSELKTTYTVRYRSQYPNQWWTGTEVKTAVAPGHTYGYVAGSLKWQTENGNVKKDAAGNPMAEAKINCIVGDLSAAEEVTVYPVIKKETLDVIPTCMEFGEASYSFYIPLSQIPAGATNTEDIEIKDGQDYVTLKNRTEKVDHVAGEPEKLQYLKTNADGTESWVDNIDDADDDNGTVTYRVVSYCQHRSESGHPSDARIYGDKMTAAPLEGFPEKHLSTGNQNYCYYLRYEYAPIRVVVKLSEGNQNSYTMRVGKQVHNFTNTNQGGKDVYVTQHTLDPEGTITLLDDPTCGTHANVRYTCLECHRTITDNTVDYGPANATGKHTFIQEDGKDKIFTTKAKCEEVGYTYKVCEACQTRHTVLDDVRDDDGNRVYGAIIQETIPALGHNYVLVNEDQVVWRAQGGALINSNTQNFDPAQNVTCTALVQCSRESSLFPTVTLVTYHSQPAPQGMADTETEKWDAIKLEPTTKDCTVYDKLTYTVKDLTSLEGKPVTLTVTSKYYGKHTVNPTVNWDKSDYKKANISAVCTNPKCLAMVNGQHPIDEVDCVVTSAFNDDGSITRTATCEGYDLKDNTVEVFDLGEAVVTTNKVVATQVYDQWRRGQITLEELAKEIGLSVTVNGVELDKDIYTVAFTTPSNSVSAVTISKNPQTKETRPIFGQKTSARFTIKQFGTFSAGDFITKIDGLTRGQRGYAEQFAYDGTEHVVTYTINNATLAKGATIKFAIMDAEYNAQLWGAPADEEFKYDSFAEKDMISCDIWAMVTKDEYLTYKALVVDNFEIGDIEVYVYIDNLTVKQGETPAPKYFIGDINHKPIGVDEATLGIGIYTAAGDPLTGLAPGTYAMKALSDNPSVIVYTKNGEAQLGDPVLTVLADEAGANKQAAEKVAAMIDGLSAASTPAEIQAAIDAFNALPDAAKALVPADKAAQLASYAIDTLNDNSTPDQIKAVLNIYNALPDAAKTQVPADKVTKLNAAAEKAGLLQKDSSITITNKAKAKVKRGKALKVTYKKTGDGKVTVKISGNKKVKKFFKVKGNSIKVAKKAKKGKYKVKVTVSIAATTAYKAAKATKTIKVTVK